MSGHISVRDPEFPTYIWMNPLGKHFGLMTAGDLICLDVNTGKVVGGNRVRPLSILCFYRSWLFPRPKQPTQQASSSTLRSTRPGQMSMQCVMPIRMPDERGRPSLLGLTCWLKIYATCMIPLLCMLNMAVLCLPKKKGRTSLVHWETRTRYEPLQPNP